MLFRPMADRTASCPHAGVSNPPNSGGHFNDLKEKSQFVERSSDGKKSSDDETEEENMDALIEELESHDGRMDEEYEGSDDTGSSRPVPEELLQTDPRVGLTNADVLARRKKYGVNQMKEETENLFLKFLSYFVGPIQFVMEVC